MNCSICNTNQTETLTHDNSIVCKDCFNAKQTLKHLHYEIEEDEEIPTCETCNDNKYGVTTVSFGCFCCCLCDYHYVTELHDANNDGEDEEHKAYNVFIQTLKEENKNNNGNYKLITFEEYKKARDIVFRNLIKESMR